MNPLTKSNSLQSVMTVQPMSAEGTLNKVNSGNLVHQIIRISIPSQNIQKSVRCVADEPLFHLKLQIIEKMAKGVQDSLNYGFYLGGGEGKDGKFLDEQRSASDYRLADNVLLEFKLKHRNGLVPGTKAYEKDNHKKNWKKLLDLIKDGNVDEVKSKLSKGTWDPNFVFDDGMTPLALAVLCNERDMISSLLENGAIIDFRSKVGSFTNSGASPTPNQFGTGWFTPMHVAAAENRLIALQTLMYFGASPNVTDSNNITPLFHACANGHHEIVRWILIWGAVHYKESKLNLNIEERDSQEKTALHLACANGFPQVVQLLVEYGFDIAAQNATGNTPLHVTCTKPLSGNLFKECATILLQYGADKAKKNRAGQTPVDIALMSGNIELSDFIKKWSQTNASSPTPLDQLVENARGQWQNVKKVMHIGHPRLGLSAAATSSQLSDIQSDHSLNDSMRVASRSTTRPNVADVFKASESTQSFRNIPKENSSKSLNSNSFEAPKDNISSNESLSFSKRSDSYEPRVNKPSNLHQHIVSESSSSKLSSAPHTPPPQSVLAQTSSPNFMATSTPPVINGQGIARQPRMPPPPPAGAPPLNMPLPNFASLPPPPAVSSFPNLPLPGSAFPPPPATGQMNSLEILAQLQKIEDEKKRLEQEVEKLRQQMLASLQQQK